jgi:hypothetical protein
MKFELFIIIVKRGIEPINLHKNYTNKGQTH